PFLRREVMNASWKKQLLNATPLLKELIVEMGVFECVLTKGSRKPDLAVLFEPTPHNFSVLDKFFPTVPWKKMASFFDLSLTLPLWLEFDVSRLEKRASAPNFFLRPFHFKRSQ